MRREQKESRRYRIDVSLTFSVAFRGLPWFKCG
jgi:hypothetical protein